MEWYPIKLTAHVRHYNFGERLIPEQLGKEGLPEGIIAETWEVSDYRDTTGTITNGSLAGRTLHDVTMQYPDEVVGQGWRGPHFPLLEKFLDASHMLPVHLHADDKTAAEKYGDPNGKSEAWHILWAAPGATILAGLKDGLSREDLFAAFKAQDYDRVMPRYPISAGDTVYVPGGIIHAFGPDTLIFEVQQTSDLAQSVMPGDLFGNTYPEQEWDRRINETLDELRDYYKPRPNPGLELRVGENLRSFGCAGPHFALERWTLREGQVLPANPRRCTTISCVGGSVSLRYAGGSEVLAKGESCVLPAAIGEVRIIPDNEASLIVCYVPDLQRDVIEPLRAAGHSLEAIRTLGEVGV